MAGSEGARAEIRTRVREFSEAELRPEAARRDRRGGSAADVRDALGALGAYALRAPGEAGGLAADWATCADVLYELGRGEAAFALELLFHTVYGVELLARHGTREQRERWLPLLATGRVRACYAGPNTPEEPDALPDAARAARAGEGYVLAGRTGWVAGGHGAGLVVAAARVEGSDASEGASPAGSEDGTASPGTEARVPSPAGGGGGASPRALFLIPADAPGLALAEEARTMGLRATSLVRFELRGVALPADSAVGQPGAGGEIVGELAPFAWLGIAAIAAGIARTALEYALRYAATREQFGRKLLELEGMQFKLAEMAARTAAGRAMVAAAAAGGVRPLDAILARIVASEAAEWVANQAIQTYGGYGYMREFPVEELLRDAKAMSLYAGVNEALRVVAARALQREEA